MKSKSLTIAIVIIVAAIAIILVLSTKKARNTENTSPDKQSKTSQTADRKSQQRKARSASRQNSSLNLKKWEDQIDDLLEGGATPNKLAAERLLEIALDNTAPLTVRLDTLEHALNLIEDEDFNNIIGNAIDPAKDELPADLAQTILDDTYNRPHTIQVTTALKLIQGKHSDIIEEAIELLEFHTDEEHGNDINAWKKSVANFIAQQ